MRKYLILLAATALFSSCASGPTETTSSDPNGIMEGDFSQEETGTMTIESIPGDPSRIRVVLFINGKRKPIGILEGAAAMIDASDFEAYGLPSGTISAFGITNINDIYYFIRSEQGKIKLYSGQPYTDTEGNSKMSEQEIRLDIMGYWVLEQFPEVWMQLDAFTMYRDGYERGLVYYTEGDRITFDYEFEIISATIAELSPEYMVLINEEGEANRWKRMK